MKCFRKPAVVMLFVTFCGLFPALGGLPPEMPVGPPTSDQIVEEIEHDFFVRVIQKWRARGKKNVSYDVNFHCVERSVATNRVREHTGQMHFGWPDKFAIDYDPAPKGKRIQVIWDGQRVSTLDHESRTIMRFIRAPQAKSRTFAPGSMPGFFKFEASLVYPQLSSNPLTGYPLDGRFRIRFIGQHDDAILFSLVDNYDRGTSGDVYLFSKAYIELNLHTFLPNRIFLISPNGRETQTYESEAPMVRDRVEPEVFQPDVAGSWKENESYQEEVEYF